MKTWKSLEWNKYSELHKKRTIKDFLYKDFGVKLLEYFYDKKTINFFVVDYYNLFYLLRRSLTCQ